MTTRDQREKEKILINILLCIFMEAMCYGPYFPPQRSVLLKYSRHELPRTKQTR